MSKKRVVITGMGAITPYGVGADKFWNGVKNSESCITKDDGLKITLEQQTTHIFGRVLPYDEEKYMDSKDAKRMDNFVKYALVASTEAMEDSGYSNAGGNSYNSYDGQSNRMYPSYYYDEPGMSNARRGRDGDGDGRYSEDSSYRRGRDAMGRYTSRDDGYSRHDEKEQMMKQIEQMKRKVEQM